MGSLDALRTISALAAQTAVLATTSGMDSEMDAGFLVKQAQFNVSVTNLTGDESVIVGLAQGDMSESEIATGLQQVLTDPFDIGEAGLAIKKMGIFWETVWILGPNDQVCNERFSIGGGRGIPIAEGKGVNFFIYNPSSVGLSANSQTCQGLATIKGVWLGD